MQELKEECIQKSENHHIKQYLINSKRLEVITIENTKLYFYRIIPYEHYLVDNSQQQLNPEEAAMFILHTHLKHFTTNGLNSDEFILILDNHPDYKNIQYQKNLVIINKENIQAIHKPENRDFEIFPIFVENENYSHWLTGIIRFNKEGKQIGYYTFDSDMTKNNDSIINIDNESNIDTQILNDRDLQGKSNLCWLFTLEFMKIANTYTQFTKLYDECSVCEQIKHGSHKIQKNVFKAVN